MMIEEIDKELAFKSIMLNLFIQMVERDVKAITVSKVKYKEPYLDKLQSILDQVAKEQKELKREMNKKGIKVFDGITFANEEFLEFRYLVRGYESHMRLWTAMIRNRTKELLKEYLN